MKKIYVTETNPTVFFAAEELKKYLRMMMPESGEITVEYSRDATDGFRLGLMQTFGLDVSDVKDTELDDILFIDCTPDSGIIAGDNFRSVLLSVYEYLRRQGCVWLLPGVDGEYVPVKECESVSLRFKPTLRYRGWVSEGTEFQGGMLGAVDLAPKLGMNVFMIEFKFPKSYYERYYTHVNNEKHRKPEPVSMDNILQWKRQLEVEIAKRGLQYHDMGHGFTYEPLGIATMDGWNTDYEKHITPEIRELLAEIGGERKIVYYPINTNLCMSNPKARRLVVDYAVNYAKVHSNVDYLHIWLADANNNHCECPKCQKKRPADWYVILLNEIDEAYTAAGLATRIVFISYMDTAWGPLYETIKNPDRFTLMIAPITRSYAMTLPKEGITVKPKPYERNKLKMPASLEEYFALFEDWKKTWKGANISFEYHFWRAMWRDVSGLRIAERLSEDVEVYDDYGIDGILEDGTQRCFFPTGLSIYVYARKMFDRTKTLEELTEEYFSVAFGEDWKLFYDYLTELDGIFDYKFMTGKMSANPKVSPYYNPTHAKKLLTDVKRAVAKGRELIASHYNSEKRVGTVSVRILEHHTDYVELLAELIAAKAEGNDAACSEALETMKDKMGEKEVAIETYYDHCLAINALKANYVNTVTHNEYMDIEDEKK